MNSNKNKNTMYWQKTESIEKLEKSLKNDEISITSTDTIPGFLGNTTEKSFQNIVSIKGKRPDKPFLTLIWPQSKISNFVDSNNIDKNAQKIIDKHWPGPLTIIFKAKKELPNFLKSKEGKIAIRCPKHEGLQKILHLFNGLFSTSANITGKPPAKTFDELDKNIISKVKYLLNDDKENKQSFVDTDDSFNQTLPSTIIDISNEKDVHVVREGAYPIKELEKTHGTKFKR